MECNFRQYSMCMLVIYGSLYVTLCFVLCPFDFDVLTIEFSVLCTMLHISNGALHEIEPRWRTNEERTTFSLISLWT